MLSQVISATTFGIDAFIVQVETHLEGAAPAFITVGLPDGAITVRMPSKPDLRLRASTTSGRISTDFGFANDI